MTVEEIKEDLEKEFGIMTDYFNHRPGYFKLMADWIIKHREEYADIRVKEAEDRFRADARRILMEHWYELKTSMRSDERDKLIREFESLGKEN